MKVVLADVEQKALDKAESELKATGASVLAVRTDVSKIEDVQALAKKTLDAFGAVHLLCNNAGVGGGCYHILDTPLTDWKWVLNVNLWGPIHGVLTFGPIMVKQDVECHIVNTASMGGLISTANTGPYNVSKHGIVTLSETLSHELTSIGAKVGVSVLCPGQVHTRIIDDERNRPSELRNDPALAERLAKLPKVQMLREVFAAGNEVGMPPPQVADMVFKAVREDQFYIITHPEWLFGVQMRMEEILQGRKPTDLQASFFPTEQE
jgi:NAD(P)-dependent dehydrogenase (short-subunit alcohol dehydrogenase family)